MSSAQMSSGSGFGAAASRFRAEVDAAVDRGARASAAARERSAAFAGRTRELAEAVRSGQAKPVAGELTSEDLRRSATSFRTDNGLPVDRLPAGADLLAAAPPATTPSATRPPAPGRRSPRPSDDDEDFSQEKILFRG
ncbi:hypothetical protein GCM10010174_08580 [Kutzneria viridogrisea]|uniref:Uncharacterized protein n=2 Tax=Kutzneria TaxID=43356 RepID=W5WK05_9PSEU|nr:hypothetical protein [Kutzneria albida]AHI01539.1 hypothetical protein KALB_8181 [Kutzneria albida DSM 43870]MBA8931503.1 hypothetical protein [Kutzneria viridogrisea]